MPLIRTYADIEAKLGGPTPAEEKLLAATLEGEPCDLGDGVPPVTGAPDAGRHVRADVLRYLITGGCAEHSVEALGLELTGAHITGRLDLSFARSHGATRMIKCRFDEPLLAFQATLASLNITGSVLPGLDAQGAEIAGSLLLDNARVNGKVTLYNARIGRQLAATKSVLKGDGDRALDAHAARIEGSVVFTGVSAEGGLNFFGAHVGHQFLASGAVLDGGRKSALNAQDITVRDDIFLDHVDAMGEVNLAGAQIGGRLLLNDSIFDTTTTHAVKMGRMNLREGLVWQRVTLRNGRVSLTAANAGEIVHDFEGDMESWPEGNEFSLDGLTYARLSGPSIPPRTYIEWLEKGTLSPGNFYPQPFTQLARVLRDRGHDRESRIILAHRDMLIRRNIRERLRLEPDGTWKTAFLSVARDLSNLRRLVVDLLLRRTVGYGYHPFRSMWMLATLVVSAIFIAHMAWQEGSFVPASESARNSAAFRALEGTANPAAAWSQRPRDASGQRTGLVAGQDWTRFSALAYGTDLVVPVIDLGQTSAWQPSAERGPWGRLLWAASFFLALSGWVVTALGAAAITGIIRRD